MLIAKSNILLGHFWFPVNLFFCPPTFAETNQELIMAQSGISLLSMTAADAEDPQTLRMVAGAVANLCGNGKSSNIRCYCCQIADAVL